MRMTIRIRIRVRRLQSAVRSLQSASVAEREIPFLNMSLCVYSMYKIVVVRVNVRVVRVISLCIDLIRTLACSHAEYEVYITARISWIIYIDFQFSLILLIFTNSLRAHL